MKAALLSSQTTLIAVFSALPWTRPISEFTSILSAFSACLKAFKIQHQMIRVSIHRRNSLLSHMFNMYWDKCDAAVRQQQATAAPEVRAVLLLHLSWRGFCYLLSPLVMPNKELLFSLLFISSLKKKNMLKANPPPRTSGSESFASVCVGGNL